MFTFKNFENWFTFGHFRVFLAGTNIVSMGIWQLTPITGRFGRLSKLTVRFDNRPFWPVIEAQLAVCQLTPITGRFGRLSSLAGS